MKRREFLRTGLAAGIAAALPGCGRNASDADTSLRAISLDGAEIEIGRADIRDFGNALEGPVLLADDQGYDSARRIWNGMHDKHPALIAQPLSSRDIARAVDFARDNDILVAVRGGGHSWPGKSVCDGGLMIDLSRLNEVSVDTKSRTATAGGGALLNNLDTASLEHGLVTTAGVVSHTGVGGFTLGGGFGRLNRKYGLAIDNLLGAEIVTADGKVRYVSAENEPELFWAIRGGGGNFGVVRAFEFQLHPFDRNVLSGLIVWPMSDARDVLEFYGEWYTQLSDEMYTGPILWTLEDGTEVLIMEVVYAGDPAAGEKELAPLRRVGKPLEDGVSVQDYMVLQTHEDASWGHGVRSYIKNGMVEEITQGLIDTMLEAFVSDTRLAMFTHTAGGAVKRVGELETAFPHRNAETMIGVGGAWLDPAFDDEGIATSRQWYHALEPFMGGYYRNIDFDLADTADNYGPAYPRLARIKSEYDPGNLFRLNSNIEPRPT